MSTCHTNSCADDAVANWRELAHRDGDGLEISLLWHAIDDRVRVAIADARCDSPAVFDVPGAEALSAFNHPFAYATRGSFEPAGAERGSLHLQTQA